MFRKFFRSYRKYIISGFLLEVFFLDIWFTAKLVKTISPPPFNVHFEEVFHVLYQSYILHLEYTEESLYWLFYSSHVRIITPTIRYDI